VEAFEALGQKSLDAARASAQTWRTGLSGLITVVAAAAVVSGRTTVAELSTGWRAAVTTAVGGSLVLIVWALWVTLTVEAGGRRVRTLTLEEMLGNRHATVAAFQAAESRQARNALHRAGTAGAAALILLLAGILLTWWAPAAPKTPPAQVLVTRTDPAGGDGPTSCGALLSADGGQIRLAVAGRHDPVVVPLSGIANLTVVGVCTAS
jgi:hypothetical protein